MLQRDSLLDLVACFIHLQTGEKRDDQGRKVKTKSMIFPRHHQLEAVRLLVDAANERVFDSVIVVTDRVVLDQHLQDTIYQFEHKLGVVQRIEPALQDLERLPEEAGPDRNPAGRQRLFQRGERDRLRQGEGRAVDRPGARAPSRTLGPQQQGAANSSEFYLY